MACRFLLGAMISVARRQLFAGPTAGPMAIG